MEVGRLCCVAGFVGLPAGPANEGREVFAVETGGTGRVDIDVLEVVALGRPLAGAWAFGSETLVLEDEVLSCLTGDLVGDCSQRQ